MTVLVAVAHGTRSAAGQAQIRALTDRVACRRPDLAADPAIVDLVVRRFHLTVAGSRL